MGQKSSSTLNINTDSSALNNPIMNVNDIKIKTIEENNNSNSNSNSNNSNNTYTKSAIEVLSINRFTTDSYSSEIDQKKDYSFKYGPKSNNDYKLLFLFFACNYFWTLIMTAVPILCNLKPQHYYDPKNDNLSPSQGTNDWYSASDVMRLVEPLVGLPFQLILFLCSGIFEKWDNDIFTKILILIWIFSASIYGQGAGFHSASNMFKNALESYINPDDSYDDNLIPLYYYMKTVWEHNYSHYMYACGYAGMQICCCIAYSDKIQDTSSKFDFQTISLFFLAACIYGLLLMGVAVDFPNGLAAMLGFTICSIAAIGFYMFYLKHTQKDTLILKFCRRPFLHFYIISYSIALILVLIWIAYAGCLCSRSQVL